MKTSELDFKPHRVDPTGTHAEVTFPNGYGASVITGAMFYTSASAPYELAVLRNGELDYTTPITDDVEGYLTESDVDDLLAKIEALPAVEAA